MIPDIDKKSKYQKSNYVSDPRFQAPDTMQLRTSDKFTPYGHLGMVHGSTLNMFIKHQHRKHFHMVERV